MSVYGRDRAGLTAAKAEEKTEEAEGISSCQNSK
jgi:hypothetical protein